MTDIEAVTHEISYSGNCYLLCRHYDVEDFSAALRTKIEFASRMGAERFYLGSREDALLSMDAFCAEEFSFSYYSDFDMLEKRLMPEEGPVYRMKALTAENAPLFAAIHNDAFRHVPNAATVDEPALNEMLSGRYEAGFFMYGGDPIGSYELDILGELPEIAAICIRPDMQGEGRGTQAMRTLERCLYERGATAVRLIAATANEKACALYRARGFNRTKVLSRWFTVSREA